MLRNLSLCASCNDFFSITSDSPIVVNARRLQICGNHIFLIKYLRRMNSPMSSEESQVSKSSKTMFSSDSSFKQASDDDSSSDNVLSFIRKGSKQISSRKSIPRESKLNVSISKASDTSFETVSISDHFGPHSNVQDEKSCTFVLWKSRKKVLME